ncbi:MAG TPA: hypothetical protein DEQ40_19670 [Oxalobacteraceae bacterium]|jgi:uncharacterized protein involved in outer membrane biogenesis|nr:hypothetical protein [Oxalobacteraceae bacterium]
MMRSQKWLVGIAGALLAAAIALYFLDWNLLRSYIRHRVTSVTGRSFAINGDLKVRLSLRPRIGSRRRSPSQRRMRSPV